MTASDEKAIASSLVSVLGSSTWEAVALAYGFLAYLNTKDDEAAARTIFEHGKLTLRKSREHVQLFKTSGFLSQLTPREKTGSAENPITKLFPATVTEERFIEELEQITSSRPTISYTDKRGMGHGLSDFVISEKGVELPVNVKNAGTRFEKAMQLVGLDPDNCIPIPAYKANAALEKFPNLIYVISVDFRLIAILDSLLPQLFSGEERIAWDVINNYTGSHIRDAEDAFIFSLVRKNWKSIKRSIHDVPFFAISARKAIRILHKHPQRTPGIGLRAWGTGASAEVNVHISLSDDTTPWEDVVSRILKSGVGDIVKAVNRKVVEEVYDPEI